MAHVDAIVALVLLLSILMAAPVPASQQTAETRLQAAKQALNDAGSLSYDYMYEGPDSTAEKPNRFSGHFSGTVRLRPATAQNEMIFHATIHGRIARDAPELRLTLATDGVTACELDHLAGTLTCGEVAKGARGLLGWAAYVVLPEFAIPSMFDQTLAFDEFDIIEGKSIAGVETDGIRIRQHLPTGTREVWWYLGREDNLPRAQVWMDRMDGMEGEMRFEIHALRTGLKLSDSAFRIMPPQGIRTVEDPGPFIAAGRPAPEFRLTTVEGQTMALSRLRGQSVLLYFWMPACAYCKVIEPDLVALTSAVRRQGIDMEMLGINILSMPEAELRQVSPPPEAGLKLVFEPGSTINDYRVVATPTLTLIDPSGVIRFHSVGAGPEDVKDLSALLVAGELSAE